MQLRLYGGSAPTTECLDFGSFGVSAPFDMEDVGFDGIGACICSDTGSTKAPKFNSSLKVDFQRARVNTHITRSDLARLPGQPIPTAIASIRRRLGCN